MKIGDKVTYNIFDRYRGVDVSVDAEIIGRNKDLFITINKHGTKNFFNWWELSAAKNGN